MPQITKKERRGKNLLMEIELHFLPERISKRALKKFYPDTLNQ